MGTVRFALLSSSALLLVTAAACDNTRIIHAPDAGLVCGENERIVDGECKFVCDRDSDCATDEKCNLFTGQCVKKPAQMDAGTPMYLCTNGAVRCRSDNKAVEACTEAGTWMVQEQCQGDGFCQDNTCLACEPGVQRCDPNDLGQIQVCPSDGSGWQNVVCKGTSTCLQGECRECAPGTTQCSPDGKNVQTCTKGSDPALTWSWQNSGDNFDATCISQQCIAGDPATCKPPDCIPGSTRCNGNTALQDICSPMGTWQSVACSSQPGMGPNAECQNGVCVDECADAVKQKSYFGCEYWTTTQDNSVDPIFKGNTTSGQGTADSDFAFVIANRSISQAQVKIYRSLNGSEQLLKTVTVDGKNAPTKGLNVVKVPWQSIGTDTDATSVSGLKPYAYRIVSTRPVTVYEFSPLDAVLKNVNQQTSDICFIDSDCYLNPGGFCSNNFTCTYPDVYAYSNDASLLLPAHILGTQYVAVSHEHMAWANNQNTAPYVDFAGYLTIVGTENGTSVTVKSNAKTVAGTGVVALNKGQTQTFTLNRYDVLQLATANLGGTYAECAPNPYQSQAGKQSCRVDNDLTGSVITSTKPVAVFGGSACSIMPNSAAACDHLEEQVFPFDTWGKTFAVAKSHPVKLTTGQYASTSQMSPDYYKVVASCSTTATNTPCPNGTTITFSTPPAAADILPPSATRCLGGTSITANNCRLAGGSYIEFKSKNDFTVKGDFPIAVAQTFAGQSATTGTAAEGDPSLILLPPVEQWRAEYTVQAAPGLTDNFIAISIDSTKVANVSVDGAGVPMSGANGFKTIAGTNFQTVNYPVTVGVHTITVTPKPGQMQVPGAGVVVYGFDSYVSYGYTGGLDLGSIVSGIDPGG